MNYKHIQLPLDKKTRLSLRAGDACLLRGPAYTLRDAGHARLHAEILERKRAGLTQEEVLPYELFGQLVFYAGPSPQHEASHPFGAIGPTTSSRMDVYTPELLQLGLAATLGKGYRSEEVRAACMQYQAPYFVAVGGCASYLAQQIKRAEVVAYQDLGPEALRKIELVDFPVFVGIDASGLEIYRYN